jgi:hypothetical protein
MNGWLDRLERPGELQMARVPRELPNFDRWFDTGVARRLARLKTLLMTTRVSGPIRDFGWVAFSSTTLRQMCTGALVTAFLRWARLFVSLPTI